MAAPRSTLRTHPVPLPHGCGSPAPWVRNLCPLGADGHPQVGGGAFMTARDWATFGEFVRRLRFEKARELLMSTSRPISEIALACGFTDQSHFSRRFRGEFGVTPNSFRGSAS